MLPALLGQKMLPESFDSFNVTCPSGPKMLLKPFGSVNVTSPQGPKNVFKSVRAHTPHGAVLSKWGEPLLLTERCSKMYEPIGLVIALLGQEMLHHLPALRDQNVTRALQLSKHYFPYGLQSEPLLHTEQYSENVRDYTPLERYSIE